MNKQEFDALASHGYNRVPLVLETFADLDTPLSIYLKLANKPYSYLLESVQGGERFGRYSFIGLPAATRIVVRGGQVQVIHGETVVEESSAGNPLDFIRDYRDRFHVAPLKDLPRFAGGLVGAFGYDCVRYVEPRLDRFIRKRPAKPDPLGTPDIVLLQSEEVAIVDNLAGKLYLVVYADPRNPGSFDYAQERLKQLLTALRQPAHIPEHGPAVAHEARSNFGEASYLQAVAKTKQYIFDGDCMQVQIGQRLTRPFAAEPLALYRSLRTLNPSPYMFYFDFREFHVVGASPEILVRVEPESPETPDVKRVTIRPIAGTRRRGATPEEDRALAEELLADPKERAEHVMLIDLGRNDVGRIAEIGTVKVTDTMTIERYSHVMHIVSNVEARLKKGLDAIDVFKASFPAGTLTGAPKVRAMEIIEELEPVKRGIYGGAVGYLGFSGDMDLAIAIRTAVIKDKTLHVQASAGIVADSIPEAEWNETRIKARAVLRAAEMASEGLDTQVGDPS
ncbi:MAG TPA: anthranilate synthase component I [Burkholderiales bacterium]|jgi:anthranilate synthase component 1|nr:anthranilate synthase component I [Burkholderiales bacterium]